VDKWGDGGEYEGVDNDTCSLRFQNPYVTRPVKWEIVSKEGGDEV